MATNVTVTLSSAGTTRAVNLDWMSGKPIGVAVTAATTTMTFGYTIQYTLDDLQNVAAASVTWISDPNATSLTSASSGIYLYQQPLAGIRLSASGISSSSLTLSVKQGIGW